MAKRLFFIILTYTVLSQSFANKTVTLICEDKTIKSLWINIWTNKFQYDAQLICLGLEYKKMEATVIAKQNEPVKISIGAPISMIQGKFIVPWSFEYYFDAGDTVFINIDQNDEYKPIVLRVKSKQRIFNEVNFDYLLYKATKQIKKDDIAGIKAYNQIRKALLDSLQFSKSISMEFYSSMSDAKGYVIQNMILGYFKRKYFEAPKDSLENIPLFEDSLLGYNGYLKYCTNYINAIYIYKTKGQKVLFPATSFFNWCLQNGKSLTREKLLLQSLLQINAYEKTNFLSCYENFKKINTNHEAGIYLENLINNNIADQDFSKRNAKYTDTWQQAKSGTKTTLSDLLKENKGKLIYIDFWASWCTPCIAEMPYYKRLKQQFSEEQIIFVFVSLDESFNAWKIANDKLLPDEKNSYLLLNPKLSKLVKKYNISSIPRYFLFNKKGQLVNNNANRPSDEGLIIELEKIFKVK